MLITIKAWLTPYVLIAIGLTSCNLEYDVSNKISLGERSWVSHGTQYLSAKKYRANLQVRKAQTVSLNFKSGRVVIQGKELAPVCHLIDLAAGSRISLDVTDVSMIIPSSKCV